MDSTALLWNFDDKMGEQDLDYCTGTAVSEGDISRIFSSMARPVIHANTGNQGQIAPGSYGLAPTPPPKEQEIKCPICLQEFSSPKVLACFHSFCKKCIQQRMTHSDHVICPVCNTQTLLTPQLGVDGLLNDYGLENICNSRLHNGTANVSTDEDSPKGSSGTPTEDKGLIFGSPSSTSSTPPRSGSPGTDSGLNNNVSCVSCTTGERVVASCRNCGFLCANCQYAHQTMHCFEGHKLMPVHSNRGEHSSSESSNSSFNTKPGAHCLEHRSQPLRFFCLTCNLAICEECTLVDHIQTSHEIESIEVIADQQVQRMEMMVNEAAKKQQEVHESFGVIDSTQNHLHLSHQRAMATIRTTCDMLIGMIGEMREMMIKNIDTKFGLKQLQLTAMDKEVQKLAKKMSQMIEFTRRLLNYSSPTEIMVFKPLIDSRIESFLKFNIDVENIVKTAVSGVELQQIPQETCRGMLTDLFSRTGADLSISSNTINDSLSLSSSLPHSNGVCPPMGRSSSRQNMGSPTAPGSYDINGFVPQSLGGVPNSTASILGTSAPAGGLSEANNVMFDKVWNMEDNINNLSLGNDMDNQLSQSLPYQLYPPRSQIKRQKMIYYCKFGEFGVIEGQFTEPSGVAVNAQNDIIVADTNNHRIQVFDKEGRFKFQFGECGKRDGQLLYPNRVAVNRVTGDYIVTERSPTHQIQIFNQYGQFMRKFGANILQHPRGLCVDNQGRIIVVECKVMRVIIFDSYGNVLNKFSCSRYLEFPNGVCATPNNEILISDNRAHCIKVFSYEGQYLRQIGGEGITNYPIGVGINSHNEVVVADNHNNFNLTIFDQKGNMLSALESKVKHAQCFDMALVDDGSVVLASKDYRLYLYRYGTPSNNILQ